MRIKITTVFLAIVGLGLLLAACKGKGPESGASLATAKPALYQCSMHPQIVRDSPGKCPICHMPLGRVESAEGPLPAAVSGRTSFSMTKERQQLIGVTFGEARIRSLEKVISASGRVAYDPELYAALEEYRQVRATLARLPEKASSESRVMSESLLRASRTKLKLQGFSEAQIEEMAGRSLQSTEGLILGPAAGSLWIYAEVFEGEATLVRRGQTLEATTPVLPGEIFSATVFAVDPVVKADTRAVRVRAELSAPTSRLRPEMYLEVRIRTPLGRLLSVPREAVLDTGERQIVFVSDEQGRFEPRQVVLGSAAEGYYAVLDGLKEGEKVVTSANFLIDSEAQFKAALEAFKGHKH